MVFFTTAITQPERTKRNQRNQRTKIRDSAKMVFFTTAITQRHSLREQNEIREIRERNQRQCVWWIQLGKNKIYEECPHCFLPDSQAMSESLESGASTSATTHDWLIVCLPLPPTPQSTTTEATLLTSALFPAALIPFRFLQFFLRQGSAGPLGTQKQS